MSTKFAVLEEETTCECGLLISAGEWVAWDSESSTWIHVACIEFEQKKPDTGLARIAEAAASLNKPRAAS